MEQPDSALTEVLQVDVARFPRVRLHVVKGPDKGSEVFLEGQTVIVGSDEICGLRLTDPAVSRKHLELSGGPGGYRIRDLRSTNGIFIEGVQVLEARLVDKTRITVGRTELRFEPERTEVSWPLSNKEQFGETLGRSTSMRRLFAMLERVASTDSPVLLEGESGTGKENIARSVHQSSPRVEESFVVVDLSSGAESVQEVDLFGYEVGVYQGNRQGARPSSFEEAEGGTLFLEEVCELTPSLQAKLLRALESGEFRRAGSKESTSFHCRIIASSSKDLDTEVKAGRFREDLLMKLSVFRAKVPPLRERVEDIPLLVTHFEAQGQHEAVLSEDTIHMLMRHDWPGNVRELRNVLERLAAFPDMGTAATSQAFGSNDSTNETTQDRIGGDVARRLLSLPYHEAKERVLETFERTYLTEHLRAANNIVTRAAVRAGLPRQSVHRMLRRLGIHAADEG